MTELDEAVATLEETLQGDLERCDQALARGDAAAGRIELQTAMAKLSGLTDLLRSAMPQADWD